MGTFTCPYPYITYPNYSDNVLWTTNWIYSSLNLCSRHEFISEIKDEKLSFYVDIPGVKPENLSLTIANNNIKLIATRIKTSEKIEKIALIPTEWNCQSAIASLEDGVLEITFEKSKENIKEIKVLYK